MKGCFSMADFNLKQWQLFMIPEHLKILMKENSIKIEVEKDFVLRIFDNMSHSKIQDIKNLSINIINQYYLLKALSLDDFTDYTTENYYYKKLRQNKIYYTATEGNWGRDKFEKNGKLRDLHGLLTSESYAPFKKESYENFKAGNYRVAVIFNRSENKFFFIKKEDLNKLNPIPFEFSWFFDENKLLTLNQIKKEEFFK